MNQLHAHGLYTGPLGVETSQRSRVHPTVSRAEGTVPHLQAYLAHVTYPLAFPPVIA